MIKTDQNGNIEWRKNEDGYRGYLVQEAEDALYFGLLHRIANDSFLNILTKFDFAGNEQWSYQYADFGFKVNCAVQAVNGHLFFSRESV